MYDTKLTADVLFAVTEPRTGAPVVDASRLRPLIAGAAITELVLRGALVIDPAGRLALGRSPLPVDIRWTTVLERSVGQFPAKAIARVGGTSSFRDRVTPLRMAVTEDLASRGLVRDASTMVLGLVPRRRLEILRPDVRAGMLARVYLVLTPGQGSSHDYAITSLLAAGGALPKLFPDTNRRWLDTRGQALAQADWAGAALRTAVREVMAAQAATTAALVSATAASST